MGTQVGYLLANAAEQSRLCVRELAPACGERCIICKGEQEPAGRLRSPNLAVGSISHIDDWMTR